MPVSVLVDSDLDPIRADITDLQTRVAALEAAAPSDHSAEIAAINAELQRLDARLDAIAGAAGD